MATISNLISLFYSRSENSLGTILLNVLVQTGTRIERVGDNNLLLVTLPNPPITGFIII